MRTEAQAGIGGEGCCQSDRCYRYCYFLLCIQLLVVMFVVYHGYLSMRLRGGYDMVAAG